MRINSTNFNKKIQNQEKYQVWLCRELKKSNVKTPGWSCWWEARWGISEKAWDLNWGPNYTKKPVLWRSGGRAFRWGNRQSKDLKAVWSLVWRAPRRPVWLLRTGRREGLEKGGRCKSGLCGFVGWVRSEDLILIHLDQHSGWLLCLCCWRSV